MLMHANNAFVVFLLVFTTNTEIRAAQVDVSTKELMVLPGQNATFMCRVGVPLQYCRVELPGSRNYNLNKGSVVSDVSYYGNGLEAGQCGFTINRVDEKHNGEIKCTVGIPSEYTESFGTMQLIVAKAPKTPELDLSRGADSLRVYQIGDVLEASCIVRDGRPVANISWYLDDEPISEHGLKMPTVIDMAKENLQSKLQNFTKVLQPSDNGRYLRCVAVHPAYPGGYAETKRQLDVKFAPVPIQESLDKFGYQIGKLGLINVTFEANPKPHIDWIVGGETVNEGSTDRTGRIEAEAVRDLGRGQYEANLRIAAIKKEDTDVEYILRSYNDLGQHEYKLRISTNPEPEGLELGVGAIIGVVVVVLFVILVASMLIFAKVTGRWCFSVTGGDLDTRNIGESSDTESADLRPKDTKRTLPPIKLTAFFKKNKDKVASEDDPETRNVDTGEEDGLEKLDTDNASIATAPMDDGKGLVYAELDLVRTDLKPVLKNDDEKTEYAEIVYTPKTDDDVEGEIEISTTNEKSPKKEMSPKNDKSPKK